jgi:hypothetical protein
MKAFKKIIPLRTWSASSRPRKRMDSRSSSLLTISIPPNKGWKFNGPLETDEVTSGMFARKGVLNLDGLEGSGADWLERFKPYIEDDKTIVVAPHRVWGPETNDLVLQRVISTKRKIQHAKKVTSNRARQFLPFGQLTFGRSGKPGEFRGSSWPTSCKMCSNGILERHLFAPVPRRRLNVLKFPFRRRVAQINPKIM